MTEEPDRLAGEPDIEQLMLAAKRMTQYIHDKGFDTIVVGGTSATTAAYMVKTWWQKLYPKKLYPTQRMPAFLSALKLSIGGSAVGGFIKNGKVYLPRFINNMKDPALSIAEYLRKRYPGKLASNKKIFILEEAIRTGSTVRNLETALKSIGLKEIEIGTLVLYRQHKIKKEPNFVGAIIGRGPTFHGQRRYAFNSAIEERFEKIRNKGYFAPKRHKAARNKLKSLRARIRAYVK